VKLPRHAEIWLPGYLKSRLEMLRHTPPERVWIAITDHYEPFWKNTDEAVASGRVERWAREWPQIANRHLDSAGRPARYSFFYPEEEYRPHLLDLLARMTRDGFGDVEVHLHHDGASEQQFMDTVSRYLETLSGEHGLLRRVDGRLVFGFIHGNWALDNSRPDGRWCGLNHEITLLRRLGCYADFTMPCGPAPMQARMVNTIYWATDDPNKPKSYDTGIPVRPGGAEQGDLLMIPGPLGLRWAGGLRPKIEIGELDHRNPITKERVRLWLDISPRIGADVFIKLFAHGAQEQAAQALLGKGLDQIFALLEAECRRRGAAYYFVSAWEMRQAADAARCRRPYRPAQIAC
jgi:hypothetical protein